MLVTNLPPLVVGYHTLEFNPDVLSLRCDYNFGSILLNIGNWLPAAVYQPFPFDRVSKILFPPPLHNLDMSSLTFTTFVGFIRKNPPPTLNSQDLDF